MLIENSCLSFWACLPFMSICIFYGCSAYFIPRELRLHGFIALYASFLLLPAVGIGLSIQLNWLLLSAGVFGVRLLGSPALLACRLPIDLTDYSLINVALYVLPLATIRFLPSTDNVPAVAVLLLVSLFLPLPFTLYLALRAATREALNEFALLHFFWILSSIILVMGFALALLWRVLE